MVPMYGPAGDGELRGARTIADRRRHDLGRHPIRRAPGHEILAARRVRLERDDPDAVHQEPNRVRAVVRADVEHERRSMGRAHQLFVERVHLGVPAMKRGGGLPRQRELTSQRQQNRAPGEVELPPPEEWMLHLSKRVEEATFARQRQAPMDRVDEPEASRRRERRGEGSPREREDDGPPDSHPTMGNAGYMPPACPARPANSRRQCRRGVKPFTETY